jgi:uncharacterized protein
MTELLERLEARVRSYGATAVLVALSGGVDSAVVTAISARARGASKVTAVTAVSPSYPAGELEAARALAVEIGVTHRVIETHEVEREAYARNDELRCFHCKTELYATLVRLATTAGPGVAVLAGANADDLADVRPGLRAATQHGVRNPLLEEHVGKSEVRAIAHQLGLSVAEKPALACLSSRVAFGLRITPTLLSRVDRAEQAVRRLGFESVRVRHRGDTATIEVPADQLGQLVEHPELETLFAELRSLGWTDVTVDREGYRQGSLNPTR